MELQLIMDVGSEGLGRAMWLTSSLSPTYPQLSPGRPSECDAIVGHQASLDFQDTESILWQDKQPSPEGSSTEHTHHHHHHRQTHPDSPPLSAGSDHHPPPHQQHKLAVELSSGNSSSSLQTPPQQQHQQQSQALKRRADDSYPLQQQQQQQVTEPERKLSRRNGSIGSNGSQEWSTQVDELAEHLAADFDNSLSALAASDLATAVASYNMSEALLALPSLTVFKQEAPSPENQHNNTTLSHVTQRNANVPSASNGGSGFMEADSSNSGQNSTGLHQLLYTSNDEYPPNSTSGNRVSSSQQSNNFSEDSRFQYILAAATSIATKVNEETLTYLNQGQSYEIKLKKLGDLSSFRGKFLKSTIRICFHERRLQYTEREQILEWQRARPGERLLEVDVPLSYGMVDVSQPAPSNNSVEFIWDPTKDVGCYVKINCISTEFTPKKHGGEKGVPFRIQVETQLPNGARLHAASCQVKVFKLKGADRKHKQDRDKIQRRPPHEQDKYQPSYECTVLSDIPLDSVSPSHSSVQNVGSPFASTDAISPQSRSTISGGSSPVAAAPVVLSTSPSVVAAVGPNPDAIKEDIGATPALPLPAHVIVPEQACVDVNQSQQHQQQPQQQQHQQLAHQSSTSTAAASATAELSPDATAAETSAWLRSRRFHAFETTFASFSAGDILRLSRDDLIQICGLADGIRLYNALHSRAPQPRLSLYFAREATEPWRVVYLDSLTSGSLAGKLIAALGLPAERLHSLLLLGPQGIHILVTNELVANMRDESMFVVETIKKPGTDRYKLLLKPSTH